MANYSMPTAGLVSGQTPGGIANWYALNGLLNKFDTTVTPNNGQVLIGDGTGFQTRALLSTDVPGVVTNTRTASYTLVLGDAGKVVEMNVATGNTLTVPLNSAVAFPIGTVILIRQYGAGVTTVAATAGVTIRSRGALLATAGTYAEASLTKRGTDEWVLSGDLA